MLEKNNEKKRKLLESEVMTDAWDDFKDGILGTNTLQKTVSTTLFLYFSVILPAVALGVLNGKNTHDAIGVKQVIVGQTLGALIFSFLAGQPLVVVMTTAPLALVIKTIYQIAQGKAFFESGK